MKMNAYVVGGVVQACSMVTVSVAQNVELTEQLRGSSGKRQVEGARIAMAHNGGGMIGTDAAATVVSILAREG